MEESTGNVRILHVDDEPMFLDLTRHVLRRVDDDFVVETTASARTALDRLEDERFDCIVSDYDMPGMNGLELLEAVREADPDLPFILFTGRGSEEVASRAISAGVTEYMQKGTETEQFTVLANRIRNAVERYRAERTLDEVEARYQRLLHSSPGPIVLFDERGRIDFANQAAAGALGADSPGEIVGRQVSEFVHEDGSETVRKRMRTVLEDRESVPPVEQRFVGVDGESVHAVVTTTPVVYNGKRGGQAVLSDVTDLRRTERELLDERLFTEQVLDSLHDVFYLLDMDGNVVRVNAIAEELSGHERARLLGRRVSDLFGSSAAVAQAVERAIDEEEEPTLGAELTTSGGETVPVTLRKRWVVGPRGEPAGVLGFGRRVDDWDLRSGRLDVEPVDLAELAEDCRERVDGGDTSLTVEAPRRGDRYVLADPVLLRRALTTVLRDATAQADGSVTVTLSPTESGFVLSDDGPCLRTGERVAWLSRSREPPAADHRPCLSVVARVAYAHGWDATLTGRGTDGGVRFEFTGVEFVEA